MVGAPHKRSRKYGRLLRWRLFICRRCTAWTVQWRRAAGVWRLSTSHTELARWNDSVASWENVLELTWFACSRTPPAVEQICGHFDVSATSSKPGTHWKHHILYIILCGQKVTLSAFFVLITFGSFNSIIIYLCCVCPFAPMQCTSVLRGTRYQHHSVKMNSLPCHFVASWRLNYTLEHIILISTLVTVFTVRVAEHNFNIIIITRICAAEMAVRYAALVYFRTSWERTSKIEKLRWPITGRTDRQTDGQTECDA